MFLLAFLALAALLAGWNGVRIAILAGTALVVSWVTAAVLFGTDYRDADGFMDCWPHCTVLQDVVGFVLFASPILLIGVVAGRLAGWLARRRINR